jgi:hypothetical protein
MEQHIHSGELLVLNRMVETKDGDIVVARLGRGFTVKRLHTEKDTGPGSCRRALRIPDEDLAEGGAALNEEADGCGPAGSRQSCRRCEGRCPYSQTAPSLD